MEPTEEQLKAGQVKEVDVRLGNFEVHLFDASIKPREVDPHHTLNIPWQNKDGALKSLQDIGANIEKVRAPQRQSELLDQCFRSRWQSLGAIVYTVSYV